MPELPEVRTVANGIKNKLLNDKITKIDVIYSKTIDPDSLDINLLINQPLIDIKTKGKYLIFDFKKYLMISHLRMEGKYFIKELNDSLVKHEHVVFDFTKYSLRYHDTRKFGRMQVIKPEDIDKVKGLNKLALEPFKMTKEELYEKLSKKNLHIKSALLDQTIISGLGNIYVDEVLFASKISPLRLAKDISLKECAKIINNSKDILNDSIKYGGTTIFSYTSIGESGHYQEHLKIHTKKGEPCLNCQATIKKIKVGGRGTYFCPHCQK